MWIDEYNSALQQLVEQRYQQIVKVNLTNHTCKVIWSIDSFDESYETFQVDKLWNTSKLYPNDVKALRKLHNAQFVRESISKNGTLCYKFRQRKVGKSVEWMQIEVVKDKSYRDDHLALLLFVKSIEDSYGKEYKAKKDAERLAKTDVLTGFYNRLAFNTFCSLKKHDTIGVVYIDLNRLKTVNDTEGHKAGDNYIKQCCDKITDAFSGYKKYRVGGDEFVILAPNVQMSEFIERVKYFSHTIGSDSTIMPMCSFGYKWTNNINISIDKIVRDAEKDMYINKQEDYLKYHLDRRKR